MKLTVFFGALLLAGLVSADPTSNNDKVIVTSVFFPDKLAKYTAEHDIVNMLLPLNDLNVDDNEDDAHEDAVYLFFVEADTDENGKRVDQGLYVMKNYNVTKLLDHGRDACAADEFTKKVFLGAKEGLYVYNHTENKAEKYGPITDSIINIAKLKGSDNIYILTEDHVLYKVTDDGNTKTIVDGVVDAQQIVVDFDDNLYYYTGDKQLHVLTSEGVQKIEGLPAATYINILRPPFIIWNGVPVIVNDKAYIVYANGTVATTDFQFIAKPTAFSMEGTLVHYYAYNKKIYEFNLLAMIGDEGIGELRDYLSGKADAIQEIGTRSRGGRIPHADETTTEKAKRPDN